MSAETPEIDSESGPEVADGRRRKGLRRRRALLDASMRLVGREGVSAVTQRAVAAEAGVPSSAVTYYFPSIDDLLVAALTRANDEYLALLDRCAERDDRVRALAELITTTAADRAGTVAAEYELFLLAARRPSLRGECARWTRALDNFLVPVCADPARRYGITAAVDGLFLRGVSVEDTLSVSTVHDALCRLLGPAAG